jgi:probable addiction module antidote protein
MPKLRDFQPLLLEFLKDEEGAYFYLEEAFSEGDPKSFSRALDNVLKARNFSVRQIAEHTHLNRENLYKVLSGKTNPEFSTIRSLCELAGFPLMPTKPTCKL